MCQTLLTLLNVLSRVSDHGNTVVGGARQRITEALENLHSIEKTVENNEQLLVSELAATRMLAIVTSAVYCMTKLSLQWMLTSKHACDNGY